MTQPNLLELAKQGNAKAIGALINRHLQPKGITAKATLKNGCLQIMLQSDQILNHQTLVTFIRKGITSLEAASIQKVRIYVQQADEQVPHWIQEFGLTAQHQTYADPLIVDWVLMVEWAIPILLLALATRPTAPIRSKVTQPIGNSVQELENKAIYESICRISIFISLILLYFIIIFTIGQCSTR